MTNKTNNSLGFTGVITSMASFNAELNIDGDVSASRATNKGVFYATHYKMKWLIRNYYARTRGEDSVLVKGKRYLKDGALVVQTLEERLSYVFKMDNKALKALSTDELLNLIVEKQDVKNFGIALALTGKNAKITGVSQLSYAKNIYEDTEEHFIQMGSAYASKTDAGNNTFGKRKFLDFANYVYNFTVQPSNLSSDMVGFDLENKYTEDDYNWFKRGMLKSVQDNQSSSSGSTVAYGMFIDLKDGEDLVQSNFSDYITCTDVEDSDEKTTREQKVVDFTKLAEYISKITGAIEYSEIYLVDNISIKFEGVEELEKYGVVIKNMSESRKI